MSLAIGPVLFLGLVSLGQGVLAPEALVTAAVALWMASWWMTEAIPLPATAMLPIVLFPASGIGSVQEVTLSYGHPIIFLFLGGFLLSAAFQKSGLHRRIALRVIGFFGFYPRRVVLGVMLVTAFLSMWISNTACAVMMLPIAIGIVSQSGNPLLETCSDFGRAMMLGVAYAASIGGLGTIIGSPPNAILVGFVQTNMNRTITFLDWMLFGIPVVVVGIPLAWLYLTRVVCPLDKEFAADSSSRFLGQQLLSLGTMSAQEKAVLIISSIVASLWLLRGLVPQAFRWIGLQDVNDSMIAILGALLLFSLPVRGSRLLSWSDAKNVSWGILILFGGGLALAQGIQRSGLGTWLAGQLTILHGFQPAVPIIAGIVVVIFLTELTSNTATATIFIPIMATVASAMGVQPYPIMLAVTMSASCAFMLPVATPPNAIVFGSGYLKIGEMIRAGLVLNLLFSGLLFIAVYWWLPRVWD